MNQIMLPNNGVDQTSLVNNLFNMQSNYKEIIKKNPGMAN